MIEIEEKTLDQTKTAFIEHDTITVLYIDSSIVVYMAPYTYNYYILAVGVLLQKAKTKLNLAEFNFHHPKDKRR